MKKSAKIDRIIALILSAAVIMGVCVSCSSDKSIRRIRQNGSLTVGYPSCGASEDAPFVMDENKGITAEPAVKIAGTFDTGVTFTRLTASQAYDRLLDGSVDCLWNVVPPSKELVSSVRTIETGIYYRQVIVTPAESGITRLADVKGKTMGVVSGSDAQAELHAAAVMESSLKEIKLYQTTRDILTALTAGEIQCAAVDEPQALRCISQTEERFEMIETPIAEKSLVIATRAEDADLCARIAEKYVKLSQSGDIRTLCETYAPGSMLDSSMQSHSSQV